MTESLKGIDQSNLPSPPSSVAASEISVPDQIHLRDSLKSLAPPETDPPPEEDQEEDTDGCWSRFKGFIDFCKGICLEIILKIGIVYFAVVNFICCKKKVEKKETPPSRGITDEDLLSSSDDEEEIKPTPGDHVEPPPQISAPSSVRNSVTLRDPLLQEKIDKLLAYQIKYPPSETTQPPISSQLPIISTNSILSGQITPPPSPAKDVAPSDGSLSPSSSALQSPTKKTHKHEAKKPPLTFLSSFTAQDKEDIWFVIKGTADMPGVEWGEETFTLGLALKQRGDRITPLHPLRFVAYILTQPDIRKNLLRIYQQYIDSRHNTFKVGHWGKVTSNLTDSLKRKANLEKDIKSGKKIVSPEYAAAKEGLLNDNVEEFVNFLNVKASEWKNVSDRKLEKLNLSRADIAYMDKWPIDVSKVKIFIEKKDWKGFINFLVEIMSDPTSPTETV